MQQICAGRRLAERKNGEQTVTDEFQYFPAMSRNRLLHRVEIAVQKINDVIARPVVGDPGELTQIADHACGRAVDRVRDSRAPPWHHRGFRWRDYRCIWIVP